MDWVVKVSFMYTLSLTHLFPRNDPPRVISQAHHSPVSLSHSLGFEPNSHLTSFEVLLSPTILLSLSRGSSDTIARPLTS